MAMIAPTSIETPMASPRQPDTALTPLTIAREEQRKTARLLKALADPTRLAILMLLYRHPDTFCVAELTEKLTPLEQPTISHHLRILMDADLVDNRKRGLYAYYRLSSRGWHQVQPLIDRLQTLFAPADQPSADQQAG